VEPKSGLIFAGAEKGSVHVSRDGGHTWSKSDTGLTEKDIYSLTAVQREDGTTRIYLGTEPAKLFFSDDLGQSWSELPSVRSAESVEKWRFPAPPHIAHLKHIDVHPENSNVVYASIEVGALLHSTDAGTTWREITPEYPDIHRCVIHPHDASRLYVTGGDPSMSRQMAAIPGSTGQIETRRLVATRTSSSTCRQIPISCSSPRAT